LSRSPYPRERSSRYPLHRKGVLGTHCTGSFTGHKGSVDYLENRKLGDTKNGDFWNTAQICIFLQRSANAAIGVQRAIAMVCGCGSIRVWITWRKETGRHSKWRLLEYGTHLYMPRRPGLTENLLNFFFLSGFQKLEQRAKKCIELRGENVEQMPSLVAVACFLPGRAKDLSAPPRTAVCKRSYKRTACYRYGLSPWIDSDRFGYTAT
jgi:hypothetical protein